MTDEDPTRPTWRRLLLNRFVLVPALLVVVTVAWNGWVVTHNHGMVGGRVLDAGGAPVAGDDVKLWVFNFATFVVKASTTTKADGSFELRFGPAGKTISRNGFALGPGSAMLVVREVFSDWASERPGVITIRRAERAGTSPPPLDSAALAKRYGVAGKMLLSRLRTFLAFPEWFYLKLPVNTLTEPRPTPGGLATQFSSVGHYELADDQAMIVTVPTADKKVAPYQGIQLGSMWYISLDYINHQTSLTADQARTDPDGRLRFVISERDPGVANWLERTGHDRGYIQLRWQRLSRDLGPDDGPRAEVVDVAELPGLLPYYERARVTPAEYAERIAARQAAVALRMLG